MQKHTSWHHTPSQAIYIQCTQLVINLSTATVCCEQQYQCIGADREKCNYRHEGVGLGQKCAFGNKIIHINMVCDDGSICESLLFIVQYSLQTNFRPTPVPSICMFPHDNVWATYFCNMKIIQFKLFDSLESIAGTWSEKSLNYFLWPILLNHRTNGEYFRHQSLPKWYFTPKWAQQ